MKRFLWLGFVLLVYTICTGCGDTFRPIIIPNPPTFPNPAAAHTVVSINYNAECSDNTCTGFVPLPGTAMVVDVSGDTDESIGNVGIVPVYAAQQSASEVLVVNQAVTGMQADSLTQLIFSGTTISTAETISLPPNSAPDFVAVAPSSATAYVTLPNLNSVGVINTTTENQTYTIPVGSDPYALAVTPDNTKLYVANFGDSTISGFNTSDRTQRVGSPVSTSSPPIWFAARSDSQQVYVLEQNGTLATLNVTSTAGPDPFSETAISVPGATMMTYDPNLNRLYIAGGQRLAIVDVSQSSPQYVTGGPIPTCQSSSSSLCIPLVAPSSRGSSDPCSLTGAQTLTVVAAAALPDGSQAFVAAYYEDSNHNLCPQATAISATSNTIVGSTAIPGFPDATISSSPAYSPICGTTRFRFMMAAGGDSSRAYLSSCDEGSVNIIDTSNDLYLSNLQAPVSSHTIPGSSSLNPPQNPVFLLAGP